MTAAHTTATICFRVIAILGGAFGLLNALILLFFGGAAGPDRVVPGALFILGAIVMFRLSPFLGRLATLGLPTVGAPPNERGS